MAEYCRTCKIELDDYNWNISRQKGNHHICKKCESNYSKERYPKYRSRNREIHRKKSLNVNGKVLYGINKRPHTTICELCGNKERTVYHHWNDNNPENGLWVCYVCHQGVEFLEKKGIINVNKYFNLKKEVENESSVRQSLDDLLKYSISIIQMNKKKKNTKKYISKEIQHIDYRYNTSEQYFNILERTMYNNSSGSVYIYYCYEYKNKRIYI